MKIRIWWFVFWETIFSAVSVIAIVGSFASEQVYKVVRPLGDCVSSNLKKYTQC